MIITAGAAAIVVGVTATAAIVIIAAALRVGRSIGIFAALWFAFA